MHTSFTRAALQVGALWTLAVAWPLLDLLSKDATFFVARGSSRGDILVLALGLVLVPPLAAAAVLVLLARARRGLGHATAVALRGLLVAVLVLPPLGRALGGSAAALAPAAAAGAAYTVAELRFSAIRSLLTALSPAPVVCLAAFLLLSPVSQLVLPSQEATATAGPSSSTTPIVHVIFDELPVTTVTDARGRFEARRFPNLGRFAAHATWYRNATTVSDRTLEAVPAQFTGRQPPWDALPTTRTYPDSVFTLFARSHDALVEEPITDVCPQRICQERRAAFGARLRALADDVAILQAHVLLPEDLRGGLPPIGDAWGGFRRDAAEPGDFAAEVAAGVDRADIVGSRITDSRARNPFADMARALERPRSRPPLLVLHSAMPHAPWLRLPDGRRYHDHRLDYPSGNETWPRRQWIADHAFQRHVLQMQYADAQAGRLFEQLRAAGLYDRAVIVVSADHGASFRAGEIRRRPGPANMSDIAAVPLLVKLPGQRDAAVDDRAVRTTDVLPTIADAVGVRVPWPHDGMPAHERPVDRDARVDVLNGARGSATTLPLRTVIAQRRARDRHEARVLRHGIFAVGPRPDLLGSAVTGAAPAATARVTVDVPGAFAAVSAGDEVVPALVTGAVRGLAPHTVLAVAVNGRVEATTAVRPWDGHLDYAALVRPAALRTDGPNDVDVLAVTPAGKLRRVGGTPGRTTGH